MMKFGTLSIFSGCSLFSINALVGEMNVESMFNIRYYTSPEVKIEYTHNGRSIECGIGNEFYDIYPFRSGISELHPDADSVAFGKYEKLKEDLLKKSGLVQNVIVIGYVDKREFRDSPRNSLGANAVLAGQRANTVSKRLIDDLKLPETSAVLLQNAPRLINQGSDPNDLEADRAVRVCVLWG